uniref:Uncharacterized protein n=1 Tax=Glossina palpalis gambiensis TaxID=67801 RepID=A0A1B0AU00_9MUSC
MRSTYQQGLSLAIANKNKINVCHTYEKRKLKKSITRNSVDVYDERTLEYLHPISDQMCIRALYKVVFATLLHIEENRWYTTYYDVQEIGFCEALSEVCRPT